MIDEFVATFCGAFLYTTGSVSVTPGIALRYAMVFNDPTEGTLVDVVVDAVVVVGDC
jgi:hypothetical protein